MHSVVALLAPDRFKVQITISRDGHDRLRRAQDLLRHVVPDGDPAAIFERALALLVEDLERTKLAVAKRPRRSVAPTRVSRHVPAAVKREIWARDEGCCAFVGRTGRCAERGFLELHHLVPFADGGATDAANLQLRCRAHNAFEAEKWFGPLVTRERPLAYGLGDSSRRVAAGCPARAGPSCRFAARG
jgi:5-methylcytosine-specific restriction endonuclease McrA